MTLSSGFSSAARSGQAPLQVTLRRGTISESVHRVHAVVCDGQGRVLLSAGDAGL
jgi:L-asparaginase